MLPALLLALPLLAAPPPALAAPRHWVTRSPLAARCRFELGANVYDLCPLFEGPRASALELVDRHPTPPTETEVRYRLSFAGPLEKDGQLPAHEQCEEGTIVCMTTINRRPEHRSEAPRITHLVPVATAPSADTPFGKRSQIHQESDHVRVVLVGGTYAGADQRASIAFKCSKEEQPLSFMWAANGTHAFHWHTPHACPTALTATPAPPSSADTDGDADLLPPVNDHMSAKIVGVLLLASACALYAVYFTCTHPPAFLQPFLRRVGRNMRRLRRWRGRPGESRLLRWAEEELPTFGLAEGEGEEEDEMVNARAQAEMGMDVEGGERVPLKPSMMAAPLRGYGTYSG